MGKIANQSIRGIDYDTYRTARQTAVKLKIPIGEFVTRALVDYIKKLKEEKDGVQKDMSTVEHS